MRRERRQQYVRNSLKNMLYLSGGILLVILTTFVITFLVYKNKLKNISYSTLTADKVTSLVPNTDIDTQSETSEASLEIGKTIQEAQNEIENNINTLENEINSNSKTNSKNEDKTKQTEDTIKTNTQTVEVIKDPEFAMPVEGNVLKEFAKDNLIYSETLKEWITHLGIDIKAERTTVVKAAEAGTVTSIKNDPRYGLTVTIEHSNNFKTVYSNLLSTEFVVEGEKVEKGQSIGTIGNSATFEISDEPHLHFEILKDNVNVEPKLYLKY